MGIEPSAGSVGETCDKALAETVIGLFKAAFVHRRAPCRSCETVELATPACTARKAASIRFGIVSVDPEPVAPTDLAKNCAMIELTISMRDHIPEQLVDDVQDG